MNGVYRFLWKVWLDELRLFPAQARRDGLWPGNIDLSADP